MVGDPGIPTLEAVFDPVTMRQHLRQALPAAWEPGEDIRFQVLKRHRSRCTFEIAWPAAHGWRCLVGKVYATDRSDVYRAMQAIRRAGFGPEGGLSIPEPLAYVPELRLLLQEKVQGPRAKQTLLTGHDSDRAEASERCAQWLARFHATAPRWGRSYRLDDHLDSVNQWSQSFAGLGGPLADMATRLGEHLNAAARGLRPIGLYAGHGHYTCGQILLDAGRTVTVDWDGYDVADPCRDLAQFLVELKRIGRKNPGCIPTLDRAADVFLKTYLSQGRSEVSTNLPFHAAAVCLRLAKKDIDKRAVRWPEKAAAMLDEGLRVLALGLESWCSN
jgi:aminoglycoside phosphotransferase (APT) family kinase protein